MIAETFREKLAYLDQVFAGIDEAHPDCTGADEAFATIRAIVFLGRHLELLRKYPGSDRAECAARISRKASATRRRT